MMVMMMMMMRVLFISRKEEQYRLMFSELEKYVVAHSSNSNKHYAVLESLMQVRVSFSYDIKSLTVR